MFFVEEILNYLKIFAAGRWIPRTYQPKAAAMDFVTGLARSFHKVFSNPSLEIKTGNP